jgi:hypothetical protein
MEWHHFWYNRWHLVTEDLYEHPCSLHGDTFFEVARQIKSVVEFKDPEMGSIFVNGEEKNFDADFDIGEIVCNKVVHYFLVNQSQLAELLANDAHKTYQADFDAWTFDSMKFFRDVDGRQSVHWAFKDGFKPDFRIFNPPAFKERFCNRISQLRHPDKLFQNPGISYS